MALLVIIVLVSVIIEVAKKKRKNAYDVNSNNGHQKIIFTGEWDVWFSEVKAEVIIYDGG